MRISNRRLIEALNHTSPDRVLCDVTIEILPVLQDSDFKEILRRCPHDHEKVARIARQSVESEFVGNIPGVKIRPEKK